MEKFYVYSKEDCVFCEQIRQVFNLKNIEFEEMKLGQDYTVEQFKNKFGTNVTFPQIFHGDDHIGGVYDTIKYMKSSDIIT
jgi:glutaredoxin